MVKSTHLAVRIRDFISEPRWFSDIAIGSVPGQEKLVQQPVHLQKSVAIQQRLIAFDRQKTPGLQALQRFGKTFCRIDPEFVSEIRQAQMAELELQNELANQPFVVPWR